MFKAGQRVVCVDAKPRKHTKEPVLLRFLKEGAIYTVRSFEAFPGEEDYPTLRLVEITLPTLQETIGPWEVGYAPSRFRPVQETNIDVFQEILVRASDPVETVSTDAQTKGA